MNSLIKKMIVSGRGMIETVVLVSKDLSIIALEIEHNTSLDDLVSAGAIIISAFSNIFREAGLSVSEKIRIQLNDKRYLIVESYPDHFLICISKPCARLGFIDLVLEYYKPLLYGILYPVDHDVCEYGNLEQAVIRELK